MQPSTTRESAPVAFRNDPDSEPEPSTASLAASMLGDLRRLGESYAELLRLEGAQLLRKAAWLAAAAVATTWGLVLLSIGLVHALAENGLLSREGAYLSVGGVISVAGIVWLFVAGRNDGR